MFRDLERICLISCTDVHGESTTFKNKLENVFAMYGFDRGCWNFKAFGTPKTLNVRIASNNFKERSFFLSTKELEEGSYHKGNLPNYVKNVLDKIVEKYMSMDDFQFQQFISVGNNIPTIRVASKTDTSYCPKHRRYVHLSKCKLCKYMFDIEPTKVTCLLPETCLILRKPISKIKHLNK